jgi:phage gp36-like protein
MTRGSQQSSGVASLPVVAALRGLKGDYRLACTQQAADIIEDMFEALTEFLAGADAGFVSVGVDQLARAALAKARGEQS